MNSGSIPLCATTLFWNASRNMNCREAFFILSYLNLCSLNINHFSRRATFYSKIRIILFKNKLYLHYVLTLISKKR